MRNEDGGHAKLAFYAIVISIGVLGIVGLYSADFISCWIRFLTPEIIHEISQALITAALLALSVDLYLKKRLATEFVRDVSPFIEGIGLPDEFQDEIAFIRRIPVYRRDFRLSYRIRRVEAASGFIIMRTGIVFTLVNQTEVEQKYPFAAGCEDAFPEIGRARVVAAGVIGPGPDRKTYSGDALAKVLKTEGSMQTLSLIISIPPKNDKILAWAEMESIAEENDSDIFWFTTPTVKPAVEIDYPDDFEIAVHFGHRFTDPAMAPDRIMRIPPPPSKTHTWAADAAMLPWHAIYIEWKGGKLPPEIVQAAKAAPTELPPKDSDHAKSQKERSEQKPSTPDKANGTAGAASPF